MEDKQLCRQRGCNAQRWQLGWQVSADIISAEVPILTGRIVAQRLINQKWEKDGIAPGMDVGASTKAVTRQTVQTWHARGNMQQAGKSLNYWDF